MIYKEAITDKVTKVTERTSCVFAMYIPLMRKKYYRHTKAIFHIHTGMLSIAKYWSMAREKPLAKNYL